MTRLLVISDIHAFNAEAGKAHFRGEDPSYVRTVPDQFEESRGPFQALERLIREEKLECDFLVCCGDMGDKADHAGINYAWMWLETIRRRLGSPLLIATSGNHDVDSRNSSERDDPTYTVRSLQPPFPVDDHHARAEYFAHGVAVVHGDDVDIVVLNTTAEHHDEELAQRGLISDATLERLRILVDGCTSSRRVLVAHHHPYRHEALDASDTSALEAGPEVLQILGENGDWLVVHGHRHYPNLVYASGGVQAPVIMAAGSFSAVLYPELTTRVRNQVHLLELGSPSSVSGTAGIVGTIRSWEYSVSGGWELPVSQEGIPDGAGFGYRAGIDAAKLLLREYVAAHSDRPWVVLEEAITAHPELRHLLPVDRKTVLDGLVTDGDFRVSPSRHYAAPTTEIFLQGVSI